MEQLTAGPAHELASPRPIQLIPQWLRASISCPDMIHPGQISTSRRLIIFPSSDLLCKGTSSRFTAYSLVSCIHSRLFSAVRLIRSRHLLLPFRRVCSSRSDQLPLSISLNLFSHPLPRNIPIQPVAVSQSSHQCHVFKVHFLFIPLPCFSAPIPPLTMSRGYYLSMSTLLPSSLSHSNRISLTISLWCDALSR
jgi:hypothetical protein